MSTNDLVYPEHKNAPYIVVHKSLIKAVGNTNRANIIASILGMHDFFKRKMGKNFPGKFYQSHNQIKNSFEGTSLSSNIISDALAIAETIGIWRVVKEKGTGEIVKNWFIVDVKKTREIINPKHTSESTNRDDGESTNRDDKETLNTDNRSKRKESSKEDSCSASNRTFSYGKSFRDENGKLKIVRRKNPVQPTSLSSQSNTLSKENKSNPVPKENINGAAPQNNPIPKIKKKSKVDPDLDNMSADGFKKDPPKPKYEYTIKDIQLFNFFVSIGFTKHQEGTKIYYRSMDYIHELLGKHKPPYSWCKSVHDSFKSTKPTVDEIEEVAKYYLANAKKVDKTIANFIYNPGFNGNSDYSPMCEWFGKMERDCTDNLTGDEALLSKWFKRENMEGSLNANNYKRIVIDVKKACEGYSLNRSMSHIHHGEIIEPFFDYVKEKLNSLSFRIEYINGEKFAKEFASAMLTRGVLGYN